MTPLTKARRNLVARLRAGDIAADELKLGEFARCALDIWIAKRKTKEADGLRNEALKRLADFESAIQKGYGNGNQKN
jgi:hypothetical protein